MPRQRVEFGYDFMSRRNVKRMYIPVAVAEIPGGPLGEPETIGATTSVIDGATASVAGPGSDAAAETLPAWAVSAPVGWSQVGLSKYVWDGWNLLAELDITDASVRTFAWGLDLSGSEQGAGGIGGLVLGWTRANGTLGGEVNGTGGNTLRYVFDGNGNVMAALDDLGRVRAKYEYGPFGETLTSEGDLAADNPIRWSTKYTDGESGLVYYGYRYYNAGTGRWLNRDPIGEPGGVNVHAFAANRPIDGVDPFGLDVGWAKRPGNDPYGDYLGCECSAVLNWKGDWAPEEKAMVRLAIERAKHRAKELIKEVDDIKASLSPCVAKELNSQLDELRKRMVDVIALIGDQGKTIKFYQDKIGPDKEAVTQGYRWYLDAYCQLNKSPDPLDPNWRRLKLDPLSALLLHELSHIVEGPEDYDGTRNLYDLTFINLPGGYFSLGVSKLPEYQMRLSLAKKKCKEDDCDKRVERK
jgi:RHS repeat-associated protein